MSSAASQYLLRSLFVPPAPSTVKTQYIPFDASGFLCLGFGQKADYKTSWDTFTRIQLYDSNVSTVRGSSLRTPPYYHFADYQEKNQYTEGRSLHIYSYPYLSTLWKPVQKN
jgi:hypothetical protein